MSGNFTKFHILIINCLIPFILNSPPKTYMIRAESQNFTSLIMSASSISTSISPLTSLGVTNSIFMPFHGFRLPFRTSTQSFSFAAPAVVVSRVYDWVSFSASSSLPSGIDSRVSASASV
ncbi:hypothetical protein QL285_033660 [Trifolium repens]|nr:hypothetical protein QL285_033660 [Trifolium repens]